MGHLADENDATLVPICSPTKKSKDHVEPPKRVGETPTRSRPRTKLYATQPTGEANKQLSSFNSLQQLFWNLCCIYICNIRPNLFVNFVIYCERSHHRICICFLENVISFLENENVLPSPTKEKMPNKVLSSPLRVKSVNSESLGIVCVHLNLWKPKSSFSV